jgi:hypothetical protein
MLLSPWQLRPSSPSASPPRRPSRTNERQIWDGSTEYTSRLNVSGDAGFVSQAFPFGAIAGAKTLT